MVWHRSRVWGQQASETVSLCGRILLTVLAEEIREAKTHIDLLYGHSSAQAT
jgi:hypothetical protein